MMDRGDRKFFLATVVLLLFLILSIYFRQPCKVKDESEPIVVEKKVYVVSKETQVYRPMYNRSMPLIFVGGVPRSGTTLMRAMLDAHPDVRCGQETRVIPNILDMRRNWVMFESVRLQDAGVDTEVLNSAIASFCLEVIIRHGESAPRLCNKDPLVLESADYLSGLFPQSKFIFMVRDGRATAHSIVSRKVMIVGWDNTNYRHVLQRWNMMIKLMYDHCQLVGQSRCMMVYYEQLVLDPAQKMREILDFLELPWNDSVLHHEELIGKPGGVQLAKTEPSTDQVVNAVYDVALAKWVGEIPEDVVLEMAEIAPMLAVLGYDPYANPPNYAQVSSFGPWEMPQLAPPPTSQHEDALYGNENQQ